MPLVSNEVFNTDGKWENMGDYTTRLKVPGGWIVRTFTGSYNGGCCHQIFIGDVNHTWKIKKE